MRTWTSGASACRSHKNRSSCSPVAVVLVCSEPLLHRQAYSRPMQGVGRHPKGMSIPRGPKNIQF